ncbi:serine/threonine protein kinase [Sphaeroforma arctica JP610]|uniref:Serine/threonine protein kinase n=1 Tax=Sphaeroforma arctica JP610 TaxID=667725 RepID=A0A0L0GCI2_9EUKA|nr:serine/threonine protein kinase [Sphaeroforma arctica JP610]KNC85973.1 serine/threonine protein kinase [Sphaeroforma arctica JP610]|eukprot:XP_014159875.1 serine/threonine protein kinase [Sphaeroforma arctica JP610]
MAALTNELEDQTKGSQILVDFCKVQPVFIQLRERLLIPDVSLVVSQHTQSGNVKSERKKWGARIILAGDDAEAQRLQEALEVWEREMRIREKDADRELSKWLQRADEHHPKLLNLPRVQAYFSMGEYEMKCAEQGLLRKDDAIEKYAFVSQLSDRPGRPVTLRTDTEGAQVAIKSYHLTTRELHMHFLKTCSKLGALRGVMNVVPVVGVFIEDKWGLVLILYYENGDLAIWITNHPQRDPQLCPRMTHQIVCAVEGLHEQDIVHCDLKLENIFLTPTLKAILGDFDDVHDANSTMTSSVGLTCKHEAPEIRMGTVDKYDKSDIFEGLDMSGHASDASEMNISALIDRTTASDHTYRPLLREVMQSTIFKYVQASRQCAICYEAFIAAESLTCRNGHVVCDSCVDDWLKYDMTNTSHITRPIGWLPCPMQAHGCEKIWEPKVYAPHVTEKTFDEAMCLINKPKVSVARAAA